MDAPHARNVPALFGLVFALSAAFFLLGAFVNLQVLPGLPLSALMALTPAAVAVFLAWRAEGSAGARALLARSVDGRRARPLWWAAAIALPPLVGVLTWLILWASGHPAPPPKVPLWAPFLMFAAFFLGGLGEELGWTAYAIDPMQARFGPLRAALLLGVFWVAWHIVPFIEGGRTWSWIAWHAAGMLPTRVIMLWLYNRSGRSVSVVTGYHAMDNVAAFLFPVWGTLYDPRIATLVLTALGVAVVVFDRAAFATEPSADTSSPRPPSGTAARPASPPPRS